MYNANTILKFVLIRLENQKIILENRFYLANIVFPFFVNSFIFSTKSAALYEQRYCFFIYFMLDLIFYF